MSTYKLVYFDVRGIGEPFRLMFALAGVPFEDERVSFQEWAELKPKYLGLPVLFEDGKEMRQSLAIARYLARKFDLYPQDPWSAYRCDRLTDTLADQRTEWIPLPMALFSAQPEQIEEEREKLRSTVFPKYIELYEEFLGETAGPYINGDTLSYADIFLANWVDVWTDLVYQNQSWLEAYPRITRLKKTFYALPIVQTFVANRKETW